jgi:excisionase family DNA binding protein
MEQTVGKSDKVKALESLESRGYVTLNQLSAILNIAYPTAMVWMNKGYFESTRFGGHYRISKAEVDRFLTEGNRNGNDDKPLYW